MLYEGVIRKMDSELRNPIQYYLDFPNDVVNVNQLIGKNIQIRFDRYCCLNCELEKKVYRSGYCYDCFFKLPQVAEWVIRPELSQAHLGIEDRDLEYEKAMQLQPHIVYLANSSSVKVGVTRKSQVPTRWIDQGAHEAIEILELPNRYLAGVAEVALKDYVSDKTNWRTMLRNEIDDEDLEEWRDKLKEHLPEEVMEYFISENKETHMHFPVEQYPTKIKSLNLEKTPFYEGKLMGVKGQYFIFEDGTVFNVRSHEGFVIQLQVLLS